MSVRIWFGPADSELLGHDSEGTPIVGDTDGVEPMTEIGGLLEFGPVDLP